MTSIQGGEGGGGPGPVVTNNPPGIRGTKSQASASIAGSHWWAEVLTLFLRGLLTDMHLLSAPRLSWIPLLTCPCGCIQGWVGMNHDILTPLLVQCVQRVRVMVCIWTVCMVGCAVPGFEGFEGFEGQWRTANTDPGDCWLISHRSTTDPHPQTGGIW